MLFSIISVITVVIVTLREEYKLQVLPRKIFLPQRNDVSRQFRILNKIYDIYMAPRHLVLLR
jgi:hypothetical protein